MDHPLDENVHETEKYAFLLGCSLRENNLEQFFSVYDAILPKHLSENQVRIPAWNARGAITFAKFVLSTYRN